MRSPSGSTSGRLWSPLHIWTRGAASSATSSSRLADCYRLCDALPAIDFVIMGIRAMPAERYFRHQYATMLRHTTKPTVVVA
jgi:hypothetical protein